MQPLGQKGLDALCREYALLLKPGYQPQGDRAERRAQLERSSSSTSTTRRAPRQAPISSRHSRSSTRATKKRDRAFFECLASASLPSSDAPPKPSTGAALRPVLFSDDLVTDHGCAARPAHRARHPGPTGTARPARKPSPPCAARLPARRSSCACLSASSARAVLSVLSSTCTRCTRRDACLPSKSARAACAARGRARSCTSSVSRAASSSPLFVLLAQQTGLGHALGHVLGVMVSLRAQAAPVIGLAPARPSRLPASVAAFQGHAVSPKWAYSPLKAILPPHHGLLVCGVLCALLGPLAGLFLLRPAFLGEAPSNRSRQGHCVEMQMRVGLVCVLHHGAQPLAVLLPQPRHGGFTKAGPVLALLSGQGHHPSSQGEAIGAQLAPPGVLAARPSRGPASRPPLGCSRAAPGAAGGCSTCGQASGSRMASAAISRADHLRGWPCCLEPWRAYASMCRN